MLSWAVYAALLVRSADKARLQQTACEPTLSRYNKRLVSRLKRRRQKKAKLARLNAEAEAAEAAEAEAAAAAARDEAVARAARAAEAVAAQAAISAIEQREYEKPRRAFHEAMDEFMAQFKPDLPAVQRQFKPDLPAAKEESVESELRGSTCTGVTTLRPSAPRHAHERTTLSSPTDELCFICLADAINPIDGWFCDACRELRLMDQIEWRQFGTTGTRCADRFRAAREQAQAAAAARPATKARRKKLRAKKQAAQAAAAVAAERERSTLYNELEDRWLASMGWEDYGSEGFSRPPPELFTFNHKCATQCLGMLSMPAAAARAAAAATTTARSRPL